MMKQYLEIKENEIKELESNKGLRLQRTRFIDFVNYKMGKEGESREEVKVLVEARVKVGEKESKNN